MQKKIYKKFRKELKLFSYTGSLAFLTVCFILLVLFTAFSLPVHAEDNSHVITEWGDFESQTVLNFADSGLDALYNSYQFQDMAQVQDYTFFYNSLNTLSIPDRVSYTYENSGAIALESKEPKNYSYYCISSLIGNYNNIYVIFSNSPFRVSKGYKFSRVLLTDDSEAICLKFTMDGVYVDCQPCSEFTFDGSQYGYDINDSGYVCSINDYYNTFNLVFSNTNVTLPVISENFEDTGEEVELNYLVSSLFPDNDIKGQNKYEDGSGGTDANNLYMSTPKWDFSALPKWSDNVKKNSYIYFQAKMNDYQRENASNFKLHYTYYIQFTATGDWSGHSSGGGHGFESNLLGVTKSFLFDTKKTYTFNFRNPENNNSYWEQSLTTFRDLGCRSTHATKNFIFKNCIGVGDSPANFDTFITQLNISDYSNIKCTLTCTAVLVDKDGNSSGMCESFINLVNNTSGVFSDNMKNNKNPYNNTVNDDDGEQPYNPNNSNTNNTDGNGNIIINNNPTFTNNNTGGGSFTQSESGLKDIFNFPKWLLSTLFGSNKATSEGISEVTGTNSWILFMSQTFSFIPPIFFESLGIFFVTCLGITVIAFIIRIILDLL